MSSATAVPPAGAQRTSARVHVQKFGTFLSNMVMPNIAAFIAWGLITALFIQSGWLNLGGRGHLSPSGWVAKIGGWGDFSSGGIVGPMITYLLPVLIAYTGGKNIYGTRGGVVGAIATLGVVAGSDIPMFLGAMLMGPLGGWSMKKLDALWDDKIKPGFEMLINNFSAGIWAGILATLGFFVVSPLVTGFSNIASKGVEFLVHHDVLPLTSLLIEPAKVLFLNNAVNHGILTPLGTAQAVEQGKSILFLLEANPGPGLGLLTAYAVFGTGLARASAPGAILIHFIGGIHEIYFPYVLAKPKLILATMAGGMTGVATLVVFHAGLRAPAAPGSIIAVLLETPLDSFVGVILDVILSATVSFLVAAFLLRLDRNKDEVDLAKATADMEALKGKKSSVSGALVGAAAGKQIRQIVFACDAGMGSSAMGASVLRRKIRDAGHDDVKVVNKAISDLEDVFDLVVTHQDLAVRAEQRTPSAVHVSVEDFMSTPKYDEVVQLIEASKSGAGAPAAAAVPEEASLSATPIGALLADTSIRLSGYARTRDEAITEAGSLLLESGAVDQVYVASMLEREESVSTYMGNFLAIPHGTNEAKSHIARSALSFVRYDHEINWNGKPVNFVIGIAGAGQDHLAILGKIAGVFLDKELIAELENASNTDDVRHVLDVVAV